MLEICKVAASPDKRAVPSTFVPSMNVTVPVGAAPDGFTGVTWAVKTTGCPNTDGLTGGFRLWRPEVKAEPSAEPPSAKSGDASEASI